MGDNDSNYTQSPSAHWELLSNIHNHGFALFFLPLQVLRPIRPKELRNSDYVNELGSPLPMVHNQWD
ncbi:hypothetical protein D082_15350 [Synechocystis sp. PCC 6714]|nr:hypothetical protein D082_15350 [Synechocystis sp. PCC 6714]